MKAKILLVDDDCAVLRLVATALRRFGHAVVTAASAEDALARLDEFSFDLVLTDFRLPGQTGEAVVTAVRDFRPETGVILMTGLIDELPRWLRSGPLSVPVMAKPFTLDQLLQAVESRLPAGAVA